MKRHERQPLMVGRILTVVLAAAIAACGFDLRIAYAEDDAPPVAVEEPAALGAQGEAEEPAGEPTALEAQAGTIPASGTWGTCPWEIDAAGVLTVHPGTSPSNTGTQDTLASPWGAYANSITKAVFRQENGRKVIDLGITGNNGSVPLFSGMENLVEVDLSGLDTSRVDDLSCLFQYCKSLTSVDLSPLDMSQVHSVAYMFYGCESLTHVNLAPLENANISYAGYMFYGCTSLESVDVTQINAPEINNVASIFEGCASLKMVDLSSFGTSVLSHIGRMFYGCSSLRTIYVGSDWPLDDISSSWGGMNIGQMAVFEGCVSLEGGCGTTYDDSRKSFHYAQIDTPETPGYFTHKGSLSFLSLAYAFSNSNGSFGYPINYVIPLERYQLLFGSKRAKLFQEADGQWGGSCYGMSTTSTMMNTVGSGVAASDFGQGALRPRDLGVKDYHSGLGMDLTAFIEVMQVAQHADSYGMAFYNNAGAQRVLDYVRTQTSAGKPVVIGVFATPAGGGGHAIVAYGVRRAADGSYLIEVYDNNWPERGRTIHVSTNSSGNATGWSYELWSGRTYTNGRLVYMPYDVYYDVWQGRSSGKTGGSTNVLTTNSRDFDVLDANGNTIARVVDGVLQDEGTDVWQHHTMRATEDNVDEEQDVVLTLPNGLCRIENKDGSVDKLEASVSDQEQMATVKTGAASVELAVNDASASNVALIAAGKGESYDITLESTLSSAKGKELVEVSGTGTGSNVSVGVSGGALDTSSATGATVRVNGKVQEPAADEPVKGIADGKTAVVGKATYRVKSNAAGTVYFHKAPKSKRTVTVPARVTINGKTYKVAGISRSAFKGTKATTVVIKSASLTKSSVKGCFKSAKKVKTVKVKVGARAANKKALKKYRKAFTKKNAGKRVTLK